MKKLLFATMALFALCLVGCENGSGQKKSDYVDLGLPSGTKWKKANEKNLMPYADAMGLYKDMMPTIEQWQELRDECVWVWSNNGYQVTGTNGKSIWLPAEGHLLPGAEEVSYKGYGCYCTSTSGTSFVFSSTASEFSTYLGDRAALSVRLVMN